MAGHDELLTETIARHFAKAKIDGSEVALGFGGVHLDCHVNCIRDAGGQKAASLFFLLRGGALGEVPIFASMSGYGGSAEEAIVTGGCNWSTVFGPVLEIALTDAPAAPDSDPTILETTIDDRSYRVVLDGLDRAMIVGGEGDALSLPAKARKHLGGTPWLTPKLLSSGLLPVLPRERVSVVSVFCWESRDQRTLEVKVNGVDWPDGSRLLEPLPRWDGPGAALLRELAVLVPRDNDPKLTRELLERTLRGAERPLGDELRAHVTWPGWSHHRGQLGPLASERDVRQLESAVGTLPEDYRAFLRSIQASGAGPGYGLLSPFNAARIELAGGDFDFVDGECPDTPTKGAIALAHAGCGDMWLLVLRGPNRGEVWVDPVGSDQIVRRVAPSFTAWYSSWLESIVRDERLFIQWNAACCATASVFSQMLDAKKRASEPNQEVHSLAGTMKPGSMSLASGGGAYFCQGDALGPCQGCTELARRLGLSMDIFKPGTEPLQARSAKRGFVSRILGKRW